MKNYEHKKEAILKVKKKLKNVSLVDVAKLLGCGRQNIYYHLSLKKVKSANLLYIAKISKAIDEVQKQDRRKEKVILKSI